VPNAPIDPPPSGYASAMIENEETGQEPEEPQRETTSPPAEGPHEASSPPGSGDTDDEAAEKAAEDLDQAGGGH
jgi:hypothetical protein